MKHTLVLFCPQVADGIRMTSMYYGVFPSIVLCTEMFFLVSVYKHSSWVDLECRDCIFESLEHEGFCDPVSQSISAVY